MLKTEVFNQNVMQAILKHQGISDYEKRMLKKYNKLRYDGNHVNVSYEFAKDYKAYGLGRVYAFKSLGLQSFERNIRNALTKGLYSDIDIKNAHPVILSKICHDNGFKCENLDYYIHNREDVLNSIQTSYGVERDDAKNLMIRLMYLGEPQNWEKENMVFQNFDTPFANDFKKELDMIAKNVWAKYPEISVLLNKKKKTNKLATLLSIVLQTEEHKILMAMDKFMKIKNRSMDVLIYDGGMVKNLNDEIEIPSQLLRECEVYVFNQTNYQIQLDVKPLESNLQLNQILSDQIPSDVLINDRFAAKTFCELMGTKIKFTNNTLMAFDEDRGMWTDNPQTIQHYIVNIFHDDLVFEQLSGTDNDRVKTYDYSGSQQNVKNMLAFVPPFCKDDNFIDRNANSATGKLLFKNGIYDFTKDEFIEEFDENIVFLYGINRDFTRTVDKDMYDHVFKVLFRDPFSPEDYNVADYLLKSIARAIYGDFRAKRIIFNVGLSNAGKGVLVDALAGAFEDYIGYFNANSLVYNRNNGADPAKTFSWVFPIRNKRLVVSSELNMNNPLDANIIKTVVSGGDVIQARQNHQDETPIINRSTLFCFCNDIPRIIPYDDAITNRVRCVEYKCTFVDEVKNEWERLSDLKIKDSFKYNDDYKNAVVLIVLDAYKRFLSEGDATPNQVLESTQEWTSQESSILSILEKDYEITRNVDDFVTSASILQYLQTNNVKMSPKKIGLELSKLSLKPEKKKLSGKTLQVRLGIKRRNDIVD